MSYDPWSQYHPREYRVGDRSEDPRCPACGSHPCCCREEEDEPAVDPNPPDEDDHDAALDSKRDMEREGGDA